MLLTAKHGWVALAVQANYFFVASFVAEALLKIFALGWIGYWKEPWHRCAAPTRPARPPPLTLEGPSALWPRASEARRPCELFG